jgi:hypothetical protein
MNDEGGPEPFCADAVSSFLPDSGEIVPIRRIFFSFLSVIF